MGTWSKRLCARQARLSSTSGTDYSRPSSPMKKRCRSLTPKATRNIHEAALTYEASSVLDGGGGGGGRRQGGQGREGGYTQLYGVECARTSARRPAGACP